MKGWPGVVIMVGVRTGHGRDRVRGFVEAFGGVGWAVGLALSVVSGCGGPDGSEGEDGAQEDEVAGLGETETEGEDRACWVDDECEPGEVCEAGECVPDPCADMGAGTGCEPEPEPCSEDSECEGGVCLGESVCLEVPVLPTCANAPSFTTHFPVEPQPSFQSPAFVDSDDDGTDELAYYDAYTDELIVLDGAASTVSPMEAEYPYPLLVPLRVDSGPLALVFGDRLLVGDGEGGFDLGGALAGGEFGPRQLPADFWGTGRQGLVSVTGDGGFDEIWAWADEGRGLTARLIAADAESGVVADLDGDGRDSVIVLQGDLLWEAQLVQGGWIDPAPLVATTALSKYALARVGLGSGEAQIVVGHEYRDHKRTVLASFLETGTVRFMVSGGQRSSAVGDFDGDGRDELVLFDALWPPPVYVDFDAQGVPTCQSVQLAVELPFIVWRVIVGDPDGDGRDSIGIAGYSGGTDQQFWQLDPS